MAPKTKPVSKIKEEDGTEVALVPDPKFEFNYPRYYSNHISIHSTPLDFTMRFCEALPVFDKPKNFHGGVMELKIPIKAEIVIPKEVFPALIRVMQEHYEKYIKVYGESPKKETKGE